jgi:hypothetical protein
LKNVEDMLVKWRMLMPQSGLETGCFCRPCPPETAPKLQSVLMGHAPDFYGAILGNL